MSKRKKKKVKIVMKRSSSVSKRQIEKRPDDNGAIEGVELIVQAAKQPVALDIYPY